MSEIDVHSRDAEGATPLHRASSKEYNIHDDPKFNDPKFRVGPDLDEVLALGPDLDAQEYQGYTPLHDAISVFDFEKIRKLVEAGANLELRNCYGQTPLNLATRRAWRREYIQKYLLEAGADPYAKDLQGESAFSIAKQSPRPAFDYLMDQPVPDRPTPTEEDLGKENWGKRATTAQYQTEYETYRKQYAGRPINTQWVLIYALDATRQEAQHDGNLNRKRRGSDTYTDNMDIVRTHLLGDPGFTKEQHHQITADIKRILNVEYPEINDEPYDRLQDRIVEYIQRHPQPIPHKPTKAQPKPSILTRIKSYLTRFK